MGKDAATTLLDGLDPEQRAAVFAPRGPVCVLAGAGTGKTRTITHRIAYLVKQGHLAAGQVLAVTFTARAAGEMRTRLRGLGVQGVQARTFHAAALRQLRYFWPRVVNDEPWQVLEGKIRFVGQAANRAGAPTSAEALRDLTSEIEWAKASLITPDDYPAAAAKEGRDLPAAAEQIVAVYHGYEALKTHARMLDFDDLLLHTAAILEEHSDVAVEFRERYRSFVVDEYQDVTPLQQRLLNAWIGERDDITVVGDANQTIYSFGGASPRWLLGFSRRFPESAVIRLERDYRSTPQVVDLANRVIDAARGRPAGARLRLVGQRADGPPADFAEFDDEAAEAHAVARRIGKLIGGGMPASEIAVLFRVNAQSEAYEQALSEVDIPYLVRGGSRFFERPEVRQAVRAVRAAISRPPSGSLVEQVRDVLAPAGLTTEPPSGGAARERWESLLALVEVAEDLAATLPGADLIRYLQELDVRAESQHPPTVEGVTLASLHAAKGLEWDAVFLIGLTEGTMPIQHALGGSGAPDDEDAVEEERRLFYVGVTRARERLWLSWSLSRTPGGRRNRRRSRFVVPLVPENHPCALPAARAAERITPTRRPAVCRTCGKALIGTAEVKLGRCTDCPSDVDEGLLDRLRDWRTTRARQLKVPAFVVFTDATLTAIAEQRPLDTAGLVKIAGIGAAKLERFGTDVLSLVRSELEKNT